MPDPYRRASRQEYRLGASPPADLAPSVPVEPPLGATSVPATTGPPWSGRAHSANSEADRANPRLTRCPVAVAQIRADRPSIEDRLALLEVCARATLSADRPG